LRPLRGSSHDIYAVGLAGEQVQVALQSNAKCDRVGTDSILRLAGSGYS
jgi:hypothetical protein